MKHKVLLNTMALLLSFTFLSFQALAQKQVTGKVTDGDTGEAVPGASVIVKGTTTGTITDFDGNYTLQVEDGATLVFSFVGYQPSEVAVGSRSVVDVALATDIVSLAEIVVVGYGTQSVKDATGAVAAISSEDFNGGVISSPEQLIQGRTAGVQITSSSGAPGAGVELRIRGTNSVRSNNNPLFVVDGVPLAGDETVAAAGNVGFGTSSSSNPLNFLNPNDIESISILKDASAAAIYGSRGANGVVFITTKKGRGAGTWEYSSSASIASPANEYDLLNRDEFLAGVAQFGGDASAQDFGNDVDWQDEITRTSFSHKQNLAYSKGYKNGSVRAGLGYDNQQGIVENSWLERITGRVNLNHSLMDEKLNFNLSTTISRVNDESAPIGGSAGFRGDLLGSAYSANPTWPTDPDVDGDIIGGQLHPTNMLANYQNTSHTNRFLLNFSADYKLTDDLTAKLTYGLDKSSSERVALSTADGRNFDRGTFGNGRSALGEVDVTNDLFEFTLNYDKEMGNSKLDIVAGYSFQDFTREGMNAEGYGFTTTDFGDMESAFTNAVGSLNSAANDAVDGFYQQFGRSSDLRGGAQTSGFFVNQLLPNVNTLFPSEPGGIGVQSIFADRFSTTDKLQSFFGRVNYTINQKYILTATVRADGSSRFGEDERVGVFPSGAFAWQIGEEDFMGDAFSTLKLRLGYGVTGNQDGLGYGGYLNRSRYDPRINAGIGDGGDVTIPGTNTVALPNPNLKWEETTQFSAGLDFGVSDERFSGSIDFYRKETTDIILRLNAAQPSPNEFIFQNFDATVVNQGVEVSMNYDIVQGTDFTWSAGFNIAVNDNEIQDFGGQIPAGTIRGQGLSQAFSQILAEGQPLFSFFLREFEGFDNTGQPIGDNQTFTDQSALPTTNVGFSLDFGYKNWNMRAFFSGQYGHYVYNNTRNAFFTAGAINNARNVTPDVLTSGESGTAEAAVSTRFVESADFLRMQNLDIGYNFPLQDSFLRNLRVYFNAQNLFIITDYSGLDPEVSSSPIVDDLLNRLPTAGIDYTAYPRPRTFTIGLNATF
ncbi:MAG: SusC/RagA family TonB-linked outer membrane protein [Cyclobacteriaceae bacterium]